MLSTKSVTTLDRAAQYSILRDIALRAADTTDLERFLPEILEAMCENCNAFGARIVLAGNVYFAGSKGLAKADDAVIQYVETYGLLRLAPISSLPETFDSSQLPKKVAAIMALPLAVQHYQIGNLWLAFDGRVAREEIDTDFVQVISYQLAAFLANSQLIEKERAASRRLSAILRAIMSPVLLVNAKMIVEQMNLAAESLLGLHREMTLGGSVYDIISPEVVDSLTAGTVEKSARYIAFGDRHFQIHISDLVEAGAVSTGHMIVLSDVSHLRRLNENMTMFLQTVSHDLRSPLTAAKGFVDMLPMVGNLNEKQLMMKDKVLTSIVDMTNLVEKVLDAGRLDPEMGAYELRRETCDPVQIVEKVVSTLAPAATKKDLALTTAVEEGVPIMNLDEMMLERSLLNLVENAVKYTPSGGEIKVSARVDDNNLELAVHDNGLGIAMEKLVTLFDRGSRVRREEHKFVRGSGLGLFIVKNVAQQHGGRAVVESIEGEGSTFKIVIPIDGANRVGGA